MVYKLGSLALFCNLNLQNTSKAANKPMTHFYTASTTIMEGCLVWLSGQSDIWGRQTSLIKLQREEKAKECTLSQISPDLTTAMHLGSFSLLLTTNSQRQETAGRERKEIQSVSLEDRTNYRAHRGLELGKPHSISNQGEILNVQSGYWDCT